MRFKANLNYNVYVKLNAKGLEIHKQEWERVFKNNPNFVYEAPKTDSDGYSKFQMWKLMQLFGPHIRIGFDAPFDTEILLDI